MTTQEQITHDIEQAMDNAKARLMELVEPKMPEHVRERQKRKKETMRIPINSDCYEEIDTHPCPQTQVDLEYVKFLEARNEQFKRAIAEARYYLDLGAPGRAIEILRQVQTS